MLEDEILDYEKNKQDIMHWTTLKGEFRYQDIIIFLKEKKIECSWRNVTNYIKYDKRILINSFKYIVFLEELFKSFINKYKKIKKSELLMLGFSKTLDEYLTINTNDVKYDDINLELLSSEKITIIEFRNSVAHNKILLNHLYNKKTLEEVLNIFVKILPKSYRIGYVNDINNCSKDLTDSSWCIKIMLEAKK